MGPQSRRLEGLGPAIAVIFTFVLVAWCSAHVHSGDSHVTDAERAAQKRDNEARTEALNACFDAVRAKAKYPSEVHFDIGFDEQFADGGKRIDVAGRAHMLNDFGAKLPHLYRCKVNRATMTVTDVSLVRG